MARTSLFWGFPFFRKEKGERILNYVRGVVVYSPLERTAEDLDNAVIVRRVRNKLQLDRSVADQTNAIRLLDELKIIEAAVTGEILGQEFDPDTKAKIEKAIDIRMLEWVDGFLDRITNKSIGLLQALAVPTAILTIYQTQQPSRATGVFVALTFLVALLLLWNLRVVAWKPLETYADPKAELAYCLRLIRFRSARLMLSIYLGALGLIGGALAFIFPSQASLMLDWLVGFF